MYKIGDKVICIRPRVDMNKQQILNSIYTIKNVIYYRHTNKYSYQLEEFYSYEFTEDRFKLVNPFEIKTEEDYYSWLAKR